MSDPQTKAAYLVSVDGAQAPTHLHATEEDARMEALRLAAKSQSRNSAVRVLEQIDVLIPTHSHVWGSKTCSTAPN